MGRRGIALLICVSTLGAINGMIFTGARIYYAMGRDHELFALVGRWSLRFGTPAWSLLIQAACTLLAVVGFGLFTAGPEGGGFQRLIDFTTPVFWFFLLLSGLSLVVLRRREPEHAAALSRAWLPVRALVVLRRVGGDRLRGRGARHRSALVGRVVGGRPDGPRRRAGACCRSRGRTR